jgi:5-methylthioribose kinase
LFWQVYRGEISRLEWARELEPRVVRHTLGCLLARVAGKSPLEYLTPDETARQRDVVVALMVAPPTSVPNLITEFMDRIETYAQN